MGAATRWECKPLNSYIALREFQCFHGPPTNGNFLLLWMPRHIGPFLNHSLLLFPTLACFSASGSPTLIHTHILTPTTFWVQGLSSPRSKSPQKSSMLVSALLWRCWPGGKVKFFIQNLLASGRAMDGQLSCASPFMICLWHISIKPNSYRPTN